MSSWFITKHLKANIVRNLGLSVGRINYFKGLKGSIPKNQDQTWSSIDAELIPSLGTRLSRIKKETEAWKQVLIIIRRLVDCNQSSSDI